MSGVDLNNDVGVDSNVTPLNVTSREVVMTSTREVGFSVDPDLPFSTIKEICSALEVLPTTSKYDGASNANEKVYSTFTSNPALYNMTVLQRCWVDPLTLMPIVWTPLAVGERVSLVKCIPRPGIKKSYSGKKRKNVLDRSESVVSRGDLDSMDVLMEEGSDMDGVWSQLAALKEELVTIRSSVAEMGGIKKRLSAVVDSQTKQAESITFISATVSSMQDDIARLNSATVESDAAIAALQGKIKLTGTEEMANMVRTVEYLDAADRSKNVIVFGWPVNYSGDDTLMGNAIVSSDAFQFLDTIGITDEHNLGSYSSFRRQPRSNLDDLNTSDTPPPLIICFTDTFKARAVLQAFLLHSRLPSSIGIKYRAKIDTTLRERDLQRATQPVVDVLRQQGVDARYRPGGCIAKYLGGNIFSSWIEKTSWPVVPTSGEASAAAATSAQHRGLQPSHQPSGSSNRNPTQSSFQQTRQPSVGFNPNRPSLFQFCTPPARRGGTFLSGSLYAH